MNSLFQERPDHTHTASHSYQEAAQYRIQLTTGGVRGLAQGPSEGQAAPFTFTTHTNPTGRGFEPVNFRTQTRLSNH